MIGVDEIDADHRMSHLHLIGRRRRQLDVLIFKDFGSAGLVDADSFHGSPQMLTEEGIGAGIGQIGAGLVVMLTTFARESVIHFRVDMDRDERIARQGVDDLFPRFRGYVLILAGNVEQQCFLDLATCPKAFLDVDPVMADRRIGVGAGGGKKGKLAAEAVTHGADLGGTTLHFAQMSDRGLNVRDTGIGIEALHQAKRPAPMFLSLVGELDAGFQAPEQIGRERKAAAGGVIVANLTDDVVDTENFLNDDDARTMSGSWACEIAAEISVGSFDSDVFSTHGAISLPTFLAHITIAVRDAPHHPCCVLIPALMPCRPASSSKASSRAVAEHATGSPRWLPAANRPCRRKHKRWADLPA